MSKIDSKFIINKQNKIVLNGIEYFASYSISPMKSKFSRYTNKEQGRLFKRLEEATRSIVYKGITYYEIGLEDRGWGAK
jgi:hypothetical protein